jgi:uncharacterized protein YbjT (DUF2867 family)
MLARHALIAGAHGLVGSRLLDLLLAHDAWTTVVAPVRRALPVSHPKLAAPLVDFEHLDRFEPDTRIDDVFCCLGTTIAKAGSEAAFRRVDHDYVVSLARLASRIGAKHFVMVSALGASSGSRVFYNRVKGEAESAVLGLGLPRTTILRPSLLAGDRTESRPAERAGLLFAKLVGPLMVGGLRRYRAVDAGDVAAAMLAATLAGTPVGVVESEQIVELARGLGSRA